MRNPRILRNWGVLRRGVLMGNPCILMKLILSILSIHDKTIMADLPF